MLTTKPDGKKENKARIGKFTLDTLSIGMYSNPLMLLREYVQNSVDAIDEYDENNSYKNEEPKIEITINGRAKSIIITDNGAGIPERRAWNSLHDLGKSIKRISNNRGFRGIGRLGGLGYCSTLKFLTKAKGESVYTVSEWDCIKLRDLINRDEREMDVVELINEIVTFSQYPYHDKINDHFFSVELHNVYSSRDMLLNVPAIKAYLAQVAPVPFNGKLFKFTNKIDSYLKTNVPKYKTYNIFINKDKIWKPYLNQVSIGKGVSDPVQDVNFIKLTEDKKILAYGWLGSLNLLGSINPTSCVDGVRLRTGNILVGDNYSLAEVFRERRFNNYLIGELHIVNHNILPNSRRDGFEDNDYKDALYNAFIKEVGLPFSKKIRDASKTRNSSKQRAEQEAIINRAGKIIRDGHLSIMQKKKIIADLRALKLLDNFLNGNVDKLIADVHNSKHILDKSPRKLKTSTKQLLKRTFDIVFSKCSNKDEAQKIVNHILNSV